MTSYVQGIDSSELRTHLRAAIASVKRTKKPLIVKHRNVPSVVLVDIDEYEDYLDARDPVLKKSIVRARKEVREGKVFAIEDIFGKVR